MFTYQEFAVSVKNIGLKDTLYYARLLGVTLAQAQLYVIRFYHGLNAENNQILVDSLNKRG